MKNYQTGALAEASCALIAKALMAYAFNGACTGDEAEDAEALGEEFADPANHFIELDAEV